MEQKKTIDLIVRISLSDLQEVLQVLKPEVKTEVVEAPKRAKAVKAKAKARRHFRHPTGYKVEDFIRSWLDVNRAGHRRDIINYIIARGYAKRTATNEVDRFCREMEKKGTLVRSDGYISLK